VTAPRDAPPHFLDFFFDRARDGAVTDVGVDLHEEVSADDHRLRFRMVDISRDNRAASRDFVAYELGRDERGDARSEGFTSMLELKAGTVFDVQVRLLASQILAYRDEFHFGRDHALPGIMHLRHGTAGRRTSRAALQSRK